MGYCIIDDICGEFLCLKMFVVLVGLIDLDE